MKHSVNKSKHTLQGSDAFWCFISYRHADNETPGRQWATWLHQAIETYEVPPDLIGRVNDRGDTIPERIFPVFRDETALPVDADLASPIYRALDNSKFLVVICSPRAVESTYVGKEVRYFKQLGRGDRVLAVMVAGEPNARWDKGKQKSGFSPDDECFPESLRQAVDAKGNLLPDHTEPIAADFRLSNNGGEGWTTSEAYRQALTREGSTSRKLIEDTVKRYQERSDLMKLKIIAGILGVPLESLTQRDKAYQLALAKKRQRITFLVASALAALALVALGTGWYAWGKKNVAQVAEQKEREQRRIAEAQKAEAEKQTLIVTHRSYVSTVRLAAHWIQQGKHDKSRKLLLTCAPSLRRWEWWYLMARCGPASESLDILPNITQGMDAPALAAINSAVERLERDSAQEKSERTSGAGEKKDPGPPKREEGNPAVLDFESYRGRGGTTWHAATQSGTDRVLLNGYYTGMYGRLSAALFTPARDGILWKGDCGEGSVMVSGEAIHKSGGYISPVRERFIVGPLVKPNEADNPNVENGHAVDDRTWPDDVVLKPDASSPLKISFSDVSSQQVYVTPSGKAPEWSYEIDLEKSAVRKKAAAKAEADKERSAADKIADILAQAGLPITKATVMTIRGEVAGLPEELGHTYHVAVERGRTGPVVLSTWGHGNLRLRDATTGLVVGETLTTLTNAEQAEPGITWVGTAVIVPGTESVVGWFAWRGEFEAGVLDLAKQQLICKLDGASKDMELATWGGVSIRLSPDGKEVVATLASRNESWLQAWSTESGKLLYDADGNESVDPAEDAKKSPMPEGFAWSSRPKLVAIQLPGGAIELRSTWAAKPFATLESLNAASQFDVTNLDDELRILIGGSVVSTETWEVMVSLPPVHIVSDGGNIAVIETRENVLDVVRLGLRAAFRSTDPIMPQRLMDRLLMHQIMTHDRETASKGP